MLVLPIKNGIEDTPKIIMIPKRTKEIDLLEVADTGFQLLEEVSGEELRIQSRVEMT